MTLPVDELQLVLDVAPNVARVYRDDLLTLYRPSTVVDRTLLPAVVFVHGPTSPSSSAVPPRDWAMYEGYGRLAAAHGVTGVVADLREYVWPLDRRSVSQSRQRLADIVGRVRALDGIDPDGVAMWAFSGGALLLPDLVASPLRWLRCLALSYPLIFEPGDPPTRPFDGWQPHCPMVVTQVGNEHPGWQAEVDRFITGCGSQVEVVPVAHGRHGFDTLDPSEESRDAIRRAMTLVVSHLVDRTDEGSSIYP